MNKKEFNVFFIESPARNTAPFRIATIARYENGSRLVSEAKWDADAISPQASALIRLVLKQIASEEAELCHPFSIGAHICIIPTDMEVEDAWHRDAAVVVRRPLKVDPALVKKAAERAAAAVREAEECVELRLNAYQATNLREVIRAILTPGSPLAVLNAGDWCGELCNMLERATIVATPNRSAEALIESAAQPKDARSICEGHECEEPATTARTDLGGTTFALCAHCAEYGETRGYWRKPSECEECEGEHLVRTSRWSDVMIPCPTCGGKS